MTIKGVPIPPNMTLNDFFSKANQGQDLANLGFLASPLMNDPNNLDSRLNVFMNMLGYDAGNINMANNNIDPIDAVNYATHGAQMGIENSIADASSMIYDFPTTNKANTAYGGYGLPLWYAQMKGLVK